MILICVGQKVCDCSCTVPTAISGVGKQHWLAGILCGANIWAGSCRCVAANHELDAKPCMCKSKTYGVYAGCELLSCHVDIAQGLAKDLQVGQCRIICESECAYTLTGKRPTLGECTVQVPHASFIAQDMLHSDLSHTAILMLASFCWDRQLHTQAIDKIQAELPDGSIVVDYTPCFSDHLEQIATVQTPVSWNSQQKMYVYLKH